MNDLTSIADHYGTDKGSRGHNYCEFYDSLLKPLRNKPITMLEIGVAGGESILMWQDYFAHPATLIYGVDIVDRQLPKFDERTAIIIGDASSPNVVYDITNRTGPIDLLIDDGSHFSKSQIDSLRLFWPHIKSGGLYICEDCHTSFKEPWTSPNELSFIHSLKDWIDDCMERGRNDCGKPTTSQIEEIIFMKSLVVIKKR